MHLDAQDMPLPAHVEQEFEAYLKYGRLELGFLRVRCDNCHAEHLVAFSCKKRGFCPSCGARRMAESAALLVDEVFPEQPVRQWVLSVPYPLRFLFASRPAVMGQVLGIVYRCIATHLIKKAGFSRKTAQSGVATRADQRQKLERLCRYIGRSAIAEQRLSLTPNGNVRYQLKTPYRDRTTQVIFEPPRLHRAAGGPGAESPGQPHPLPRGVCVQQRIPCARDTGQAG